MKDRMDMAGQLTLVLRDRSGAVVLERGQPNRIVAGGRRLVAEMFAGHTTGAPRTPVSTIAVGTGSTAPTDADTMLGAQRGDRIAITKVDYGTFTDPGSKVDRVRVQLSALLDFTVANDPATPLREAGLFNDANVLYSRVVFQPVTKTDTFQLTLIWEIVF
ncbi:hypothetical protein [Humibacillus xanthopallidus]|uniref:Tail-collar fiber protein n=1 Tax=Humibacillus xanthopallidus TaxID=412689 RepID=A0A543HUC7_9MICO|nr:hypothetical protein [Humibacillus xanthopallidus]TQM61951.1 hypothetical protein FBY41_1973 [Humibacillus xanthopallidus]